jgi:hypothetical protein
VLGPLERANLYPVTLSVIRSRQNPLESTCCRGLYSVRFSVQ